MGSSPNRRPGPPYRGSGPRKLIAMRLDPDALQLYEVEAARNGTTATREMVEVLERRARRGK